MTFMMWRRLDVPGHEVARLSGFQLSGTAIFLHEGRPVKLDYVVDCDAAWRTSAAAVTGFIGDVVVNSRVDVNDGRWRLNGLVIEGGHDWTDVDLNFSPSTNLLPIRRCALSVGEEVTVTAAWLRFPSFRLEALRQTYRRTGPATYLYASASFQGELEVDDEGFVRRYANIWVSET